MEYIYTNQFVTSDEPLDPTKFDLGSTLEDYSLGKYVPLNEEQIEYMHAHPMASPEEVFMMSNINFTIRVQDLADKMFNYFNANHKYFLLNNERVESYDLRELLFLAQLYQKRNRNTMDIQLNGKLYRGSTEYIVNMLEELILYYFDVENQSMYHYKYVAAHPEQKTTYDYTTGFPEILSYTLQEII